MPRRARAAARSLRAYPDTWRLVGDRRSFRAFRRLDDENAGAVPGEQVEIRFRELRGIPVHLRPGTADRYLARDAFFKAHHLPPGEIDPASLALVWDLGANVGLTMLHLAVLHPAATVVGVELDSGNTALCARNVAPLGGRCQVIHAAVWTTDGEVAYRAEPGDEQGFHVDGEGTATAPALSLNSLLERGDGRTVDYVKMDIEGAEAAVLRQRTEWAAHVRAIKVEVHPPYGVEDCERDLQALGFRTARLAKRRGGVAGVR